MTTFITTQHFQSTYPIIRDGITLDCELTWEAEIFRRQSRNWVPYGMGEASFEHEEIEHIQLVPLSTSIPITDDEMCEALKEAIKEAWAEL